MAWTTAYYAAMNAAKIRKQIGLSQGELAAIVGVEQPTISRFERGLDSITLRLIKQIAEALGVSVADLFSDDRTEAERALIAAYRSLPEGRRQGWNDLAQAFLQDQD